MKKATLISLIALVLLFGCASIETPFQVTITEFSDGAGAASRQYDGPGSYTVDYNMSRYLWAYYYPHAGWPDNVTVIAVEFDMCGIQHLSSYPSNITIRYPQFSGTGALLHAGQLNGCVHVSGDGGLLDSLITMDANPLECCERQYVDKVEMRYPRVYNTTEKVELVIWDNGRNVTGANYTCFTGDITRQVTGNELFERNTTYSTPSVFNFTCPAYGAEGKYRVSVNRIATFDGITYNWINTPGYYTDVVIADGGTDERFVLLMNVSSESAGKLDISNISIRYNNRLEYGSGPTSTITGSTPPWASTDSVISDSVLEAETDIGNNSNFDGCNVIGSIVDITNCTNSTIIWSSLDIVEVVNSTIKYTQSNNFRAYDSTIINGDMIFYFDAYGAYYDDGILYDGLLDFNMTKRALPVSGIVPLSNTYGCNGSNAKWIFDGIDGLGFLDTTWEMYNNCEVEMYDTLFGLGGNAAMLGQQKVLLEKDTMFVLFNLTAPMVLDGATFKMDDTSSFAACNASVTFNNALTLNGVPRFMVVENGQLTFSNLNDVYPEIWITMNDSPSDVYLRDINFSDYGPAYTITDQYVLGERFVSFDDASMLFINSTNATVVLYGVGIDSRIYYYENYTDNITEILANGQPCDAPRCTNIRYERGGLMFDVTGLSSYGVVLAPPPSGRNGDQKNMDVRVESGYTGETVMFTTSVERVWIEIFDPVGDSVAIFRTDENGIGYFVPEIPGTYCYEASKSGYRTEDGSFTVDEPPEEEIPEEEPVEEEPPEEVADSEVPEEEVEEEITEEEVVEEPEVMEEEQEEMPAEEEPAPAEPEEEPEEECANLFGICWYWWFALGIVAVLAYFVARTLTRR